MSYGKGFYEAKSNDSITFSNYGDDEYDHRIPRLREAYGFARALFVIGGTEKQTFYYHCDDFNRLFHRWHDHKGTLCVYTKVPMFEQTEAMIRRAWQSVGEDHVEFIAPGEDESYLADFHDQHSHYRSWPKSFAVRPSSPKHDIDKMWKFAESLNSFYYVHGDLFVFNDEDDAILFKMRW